jgi:sugar phosphate isomerase/epimerase
MHDDQPESTTPAIDRRHFLGRATAVAGVAAAAGSTGIAPGLAAEESATTNGRIKQSIVFWCFNVAGDKWDTERTCQVAKQLGLTSIELLDPEHWPTLKKHGLTCAIAPNGMPGAPFMRGFNNPKYRDEVISSTTKMIDACAEAGVPSVIAFTGYKWRDADDPKSGEISRQEGFDHCVAGFKKIIGYAEKKGVNICIEHLNSRDDSHPMKGHPGYQGDDVDYVAEICRQVGSPRMKMLFDIYHVQIMNGDVIRRLGQHKDVIGHVHTAGNPGRGELDDKQEINYPPIMRKLIDIGYTGYVGQEFIPTRDPLAGLQQAVRLCDV